MSKQERETAAALVQSKRETAAALVRSKSNSSPLFEAREREQLLLTKQERQQPLLFEARATTAVSRLTLVEQERERAVALS